MSGGRYLLLFLGEDGAPPRWLRLADGIAVGRGDDAAAIPPASVDGPRERVVAVVPAADVVLHWVELPRLAAAQALAAARLLAAEASAEPLERLHVALGPQPEDAAARPMAVTSAAAMAGWLARAQALGVDPDHVVPETLLVAPLQEGLREWRSDGLVLVRGPATAFAAEPELAALATAGEPVERLDAGGVEAGLGAVLAALPVDLRQGPFAKRRRWRIDWPLIRRLAWLGAGILLLTLLVQLVLILRYTVAADRLELDAQAVARRVLPRAARIANPPAQLNERLAELRGGGLGFGPMAAAAFAAVRDTGNVELGSFEFASDGSLRIAVLAPGAAEIAAVQQRLSAQGFEVTSSALRSAGGRQVADLTVRAR